MPAEKGWSDATYGGSWGKPGQTERGFLLNAPFSNKFPSGGYITTPEDLVRFGEAHQGPGFLKSDTLQQLSCRGKVQAEQGAMLEIEMPRGITQEDVWKACDALLLEGARPPIERVRQKIGRGSPNTVSPYLEIWFKHLGGRIRDPGAFAAPPEVPDVVLQAAKHFWEGALAETRRDFDERLREGLAAAVSNVEAEKERGAIANAAAFEATAKAARMQGELVS